MISYLKGVGIAVSQLGHALLNRNPKVTISASIGKQVIAGRTWAIRVDAVLSWMFGEDHSLNAYYIDRHYARCAHDE